MNKKIPLPSTTDIDRVLKQNTTKLYSFPPVIAKLLQIRCDHPDALEELTSLVKTDPGISTRLLGVVNSALYSLVQKVTTIRDAVIFIGFDEVKKLALGATVFEKVIKNGEQKTFDRFFFWRHCLSVAALSRAIAIEIGDPRPEEAYVTGLLHDLGKILFDRAGRVNYNDFITSAADTTGQMITLERELMGMGHDDLGAFYAVKWHLPRSVTLAVKYHHRLYAHLDLTCEEQRLISIVSLANFLAWTQGMGSADILRPPDSPAGS